MTINLKKTSVVATSKFQLHVRWKKTQFNCQKDALSYSVMRPYQGLRPLPQLRVQRGPGTSIVLAAPLFQKSNTAIRHFESSHDHHRWITTYRMDLSGRSSSRDGYYVSCRGDRSVRKAAWGQDDICPGGLLCLAGRNSSHLLQQLVLGTPNYNETRPLPFRPTNYCCRLQIYAKLFVRCRSTILVKSEV